MGKLQRSAPKYVLKPSHQHPKAPLKAHEAIPACRAWHHLPGNAAAGRLRSGAAQNGQGRAEQARERGETLAAPRLRGKKPPRLFIDSSAPFLGLILERRLGSSSPHTLTFVWHSNSNTDASLQKDFGHILDTAIASNPITFHGQGLQLPN